ncbi:hypothetical protein PMAYCL1PPCAC_12060 [Pristionchus mayeri]|uniref:Major sperm protein n=1 Tax=Pristionchus mayeri TaxID=1317129 RepID=A0AAN4ZRJ2_9BILA|nr:hypothetical protein PMAYCL1PPCAC_12060 [Pristionchus mayeri]
MNCSLRSSRRLSTVSNDSARLAISISELRSRLDKELLRKCSPSDCHRLLREEWWLSTFLLCYSNDVDVCLAVVTQCLKWRISFQVEYIGLLSIKHLLDRKMIYIHGFDVERNPVLWIRMREHTNGDRDTEKALIFWIERHYMESRGAPFSILIDMIGTTLVNLDYDLFKFMLHSLKYYYPNCAQDLLIFESPSMLSASWKIIRTWLDIGHPQLTLVNRDSITRFIHPRFLPDHMGGEDPWEFSMEEIARCIPSRALNEEIIYENGIDKDEKMGAFPNKRSVKFESEDEDTTRRTPLIVGIPTVRKLSKGPSSRRSMLPSSLRPLADRRVHAPSTDWAVDRFLSVCPRDELSLSRLDESSNDLVDIVAVRNTSDRYLMFKIKTTSPEKFRVRPSGGRVAPGATEVVRVYLQNEYRSTGSREKFLLMALQHDSTNIEEFGELWNNSPHEWRAEHKLRCKIVEDDSSSNGSTPKERSGWMGGSPDMESIRHDLSSLSSNQKILGIIVVFLLLLQFMCILNERSNNASLRLAIETLATANKVAHDGI